MLLPAIVLSVVSLFSSGVHADQRVNTGMGQKLAAVTATANTDTVSLDGLEDQLKQVVEMLNTFAQKIAVTESYLEAAVNKIDKLEERIAKLEIAPTPETPRDDTEFKPRSENRNILADSVFHNGVQSYNPDVTLSKNSRNILVPASAVAYCRSKGYRWASKMAPVADSGGAKCEHRRLRDIAIVSNEGPSASFRIDWYGPCEAMLERVTCYERL